MIKRFTRGPAILVQMANEILAIVEEHTVKPGVGVRVKKSRGGQILDVIQSAGSSDYVHPLTVYNASTGSTAAIGVTPGAFNGTIIPTIGGNPINVKIGSPLAYPTLTITSGSDVVLYFKMDYNTSNVLQTVEILAGTSIPSATIVPGTAGSDYYGLSTITVVTGTVASVTPLNDYVSGPQGYAQCGTASNCWLK